MRYKADHDFHIHSVLSNCCHDESQTTTAIFRYAISNGYKKICLTNHFWDETVAGASAWYSNQNFTHISSALPLPQADDLQFSFGAETEMDKHFTLAASKENIAKLDFLIVPTTHMHMKGFTIPLTAVTPKKRAALWLKRLDALLKMNLPWQKTGIAHLTCNHISDAATVHEVISLIDKDKMYSLFKKCADLGAGIELNFNSFLLTDENRDILLAPYRLAREAGCKFYLGSDAHSANALKSAKDNFENIITLLDLKEADKFDFQ